MIKISVILMTYVFAALWSMITKAATLKTQKVSDAEFKEQFSERVATLITLPITIFIWYLIINFITQ